VSILKLPKQQETMLKEFFSEDEILELAGLEELQLVVEDPNDAGRACGLTETKIRTAFTNVVGATETAACQQFTGITTARAKNGTCASAGLLKLITVQNITLKFSGKDSYAILLL
jgi:hypothetical protein